MNKFFGLRFGLVRPDTCRPNSLNQANLVTAIAAMLALSTTCADAAKRHVGKAPRFAVRSREKHRRPRYGSERHGCAISQRLPDRMMNLCAPPIGRGQLD
jgi:hypothetical protein